MSRNIKQHRDQFPVIFEIDGNLFMEFYDIDQNRVFYEEVSEDEAARWGVEKEKS